MPEANLPSASDELGIGRRFLTTAQFARLINHAPQTLRKLHCNSGEAFGIRPRKIGNRLLWPVADVDALLAGEVSK